LDVGESAGIDEDKEIDNFMNTYHFQNVIDNYLPKVQISFISIIALMSLIFIYLENYLEQTELIQLVQAKIQIFIVLIVLAIMHIHFFPQYYSLVVPCFIAYGMDWVVSISINQKEYPLSEVALPCLTSWFMNIYIAPSQMKSNWAAFVVGWMYYLCRLHYERNMLTPTFALSGMLWVIYFIISSVVCYFNLKTLYRQIYLNKKQASETQRVLEVFPHGVIIHSGDNEAKFNVNFTNHEFKEQIRCIQDRVEELLQVRVLDGQKDSETNLVKFLVSKQEELIGDNVTELKKLTVKWKQNIHHRRRLFESEVSDEENEKKVFTVKSMRVNWHGKQSFMHVFFINSDILKLEEANNNIQLQKIMFASVSHEFRTPLNAIIHSFNLSRDVFDEFFDLVNRILKKSK
jgi:K+-sensing histidine kinase KdpD